MADQEHVAIVELYFMNGNSIVQAQRSYKQITTLLLGHPVHLIWAGMDWKNFPFTFITLSFCHPLFEENGGILIWVCPSVPLSVCPSVALWFPCSNCSKNCSISSKFGMQVHKDNSQAKFEGQCDSCICTHIN